MHQFDHAIAAVDLPDGRVFTDLTVAFLPLGTLPIPQEGGFGLLVWEDGTSEELTFPLVSPAHNEGRSLIRGEIDAEGRFAGWFEYSASGPQAWSMRNNMSTPYDSTDRATFIREAAAKAFTGSRGDSLELFDGKDLTAPAKIRFFLSGGRAARRSGSAWILPQPLGSMSAVGTLVERLDSEGERIFPIDASVIHGLGRQLDEFVVDLPSGWKPHLPPDVELVGEFGRYSTTYRFSGRRLVIRRDVEGRRGVLPPERIGDLKKWLQGVAADDAEFLTLEVSAP